MIRPASLSRGSPLALEYLVLKKGLFEFFICSLEKILPCSLYLATRQELGDPDPFRMRYRDLIIETIGEIIRGCMDKQSAVAAIRKKSAEKIMTGDKPRFEEVIETELMMSLHQGNIARFRLRPSEYDLWVKTWR